MRYRKKPVVIDAVDYVTAVGVALHGDSGPGWLHDAVNEGILEWDAVHWLVIDTLEGQMRAGTGDFIIRGVQGEIYPCKPAIFGSTYERVDDDE